MLKSPPARRSYFAQRLTLRLRVRFASLFASALPEERRVSACRGWAGEMSGHFEHPAWLSDVISHVEIYHGLRSPGEFFRNLLEGQFFRGILFRHCASLCTKKLLQQCSALFFEQASRHLYAVIEPTLSWNVED